MKHKATLLRIILLLLMANSLMAQDWKPMSFRLQVGYSFSGFNVGTGHMVQLGICKPALYYDGGDGVLSTVPLMGQAFSANLIGLFTDGKFHPGVKVGYEAQLLILGGKLEASFLDKYIFLTPSLGIGIATRGGVYVGYNICVNNSEKSGFQVGISYNFLKLSAD